MKQAIEQFPKPWAAVSGTDDRVTASQASPVYFAAMFAWTMSAIACGIVAGIGYCLVINSRGYATVLAPEQAATGLLHMDTVFHAAIANMIVHHGAISTGLDGFVPLNYHVLSHIWLACLGLWLGVTTPESYYLGAQIVAIPIQFFSLALAAYSL